MSTFQKDVSFINPAFFDTEANQHIVKEVTKLATFKELSRNDKDQRKFQFKMTSIFKQKDIGEISIDHEILCDITEQFIEVALITDPSEFTEADKLQFTNDNIAIIQFALWLLQEKLSPFFTQLVKSMNA